ncbi:hypothetical protein SAMD00019534_040150, partial [Acytostelium subglobosum LB1]|uniref:hypothetical protein n=1 Tax=Acytostelium subglobosum LB1 TaxID=1410327 RepID=UPI0006450887
ITLIVVTLFLVFNDKVNSQTHRVPHLWTQTVKALPNDIVEFRVALRQHNLDVLESTLLDVSDPKSDNYGKHWTIDQIMGLISPSSEVSNNVVQFLMANGVENVENHRDFIKASASVETIEYLFNVDMFIFEHKTKRNHFITSSS